MHGYAMRSVAPASEAVSIAHSLGQGTSTAFSVWAFEASDTVTPSLTNAAAALRLLGVIRFNVPSSSSSPHRPQYESSVRQRSYSACVTRDLGDAPEAMPCDFAAGPPSAPPITNMKAATTRNRIAPLHAAQPAR